MIIIDGFLIMGLMVGIGLMLHYSTRKLSRKQIEDSYLGGESK